MNGHAEPAGDAQVEPPGDGVVTPTVRLADVDQRLLESGAAILLGNIALIIIIIIIIMTEMAVFYVAACYLVEGRRRWPVF